MNWVKDIWGDEDEHKTPKDEHKKVEGMITVLNKDASRHLLLYLGLPEEYAEVMPNVAVGDLYHLCEVNKKLYGSPHPLAGKTHCVHEIGEVNGEVRVLFKPLKEGGSDYIVGFSTNNIKDYTFYGTPK